MAVRRSPIFFSIILLCVLVLGGCNTVKDSLFGTPTPLPTPTPEPYLGQVSERTAYHGWAITVSNVMRSDLNPVEISPKPGIPNDEYEFISMDVTLERTIDERGSVHGNDFNLVDNAGKEYGDYSGIRNWDYGGDIYMGNVATQRIAFHVPRAAQGLKLQFSPWPSIPEPLEVALNEMKEVRRIDLMEAIELGLLTADVRGVSLESIEVEISLEVDESLELTILPGTMFLAPSADLQTMVVRRQMYIFLDKKDEVSLDVKVACANMRLDGPSGGESYIVQIQPPQEELRKLLGLPEFQDASFRLQQFAIWTITDKPSRGGYVGLGTGDGTGSGPSSTELGTIAAWFQAAGLALADYPALNP